MDKAMERVEVYTLVHNRVRNQVPEVIAFQQMEQAAVDYIEQAGFAGDQVRGLRPGAFIARNLSTGAESRGKVI